MSEGNGKLILTPGEVFEDQLFVRQLPTGEIKGEAVRAFLADPITGRPLDPPRIVQLDSRISVIMAASYVAAALPYLLGLAQIPQPMEPAKESAGAPEEKQDA